MNASAGRYVVRVRALLGIVVGLVVPGLGCTESAVPAPIADTDHARSTAYSVALTARTFDGLPACTMELSGTTAFVASPPSLWRCKDNRKWNEIKCDHSSAGAVAYASATQTLWACVANQWTAVTLPAGPAGAMGAPGTMGAPGSLVAAQSEPAGDHCPAGGQRIEIGADANSNGTLDPAEITQTVYVCNGSAAAPVPTERPLVVSCLMPAANSVLSVSPGTSMLVQARVTGGSGVQTARVNGIETGIANDGSVVGLVSVRHGLNTVEFEVTDSSVRRRRVLCPFLAADGFVRDTESFADGLSLRLRQSAIDDGVHTGGIDSLTDVLAPVLKSEGIRTLLDQSLKASNPLRPEDCVESPLGSCAFRVGVSYLSSVLPEPTVEMALVSGGITTRVRVARPSVRVQLLGDFSSTGNLTAEFVEVNTTFDVGAQGGRPQVSVRTVNVQVGAIDSDFSGLLGPIVDLLVDFMNGTFRDVLANALQNLVVQEVSRVMDGLVSSLQFSPLESSYAAPRADGSGDVPMSFSTGFSNTSATTTGLLVGLSTRFSAPAATERPTPGIPIPAGSVLPDPAAGQPIALAAHVGVLGQAVHAYWRGGGLDGSVVVDGVTVTFTTPMPPAVMMRDASSVALDIGIDATVSPPGATAPITGRGTARVAANAVLIDGDIFFNGMRASESHVELDGLGDAAAAALRNVAIGLLERLAGAALNEAMPKLPVPTFTIPSALSAYGLPGGSQLGLVGEMLTFSARHAEVVGTLGLR